MEERKAELICTRGPVEPKLIYSCKWRTNCLLRTNLLTGELKCQRVPGYKFNVICRVSELPAGSLLTTGGGSPAVREVVKIDTLREYAVCSLPPMHTARYGHAAVYHSQYLYVLGGYSDRCLSECERYVCAETRWEVLPALPVAGWAMSAVVLDYCLYALGGEALGGDLDTIQKLSLDSLTWELMQLKLPQAACRFPSFKTETEVYLVIKETLYLFTPMEVKPMKSLPQCIRSDSSHYSRGTLYYSVNGDIRSMAVGKLA
jgi:hypothetical protein